MNKAWVLSKDEEKQYFMECHKDAKRIIETLKELYPEDDFLQKELQKLDRSIKGMNFFDN